MRTIHRNLMVSLILAVSFGLILTFALSGCKNTTGAVSPQVTPNPSGWTMTPASWTIPSAPTEQPPIHTRKTYVIEKLPSSWPVGSAVKWLDQYTGSKWVMAKKCPQGAYRCVVIEAGNLSAPSLAETFNYQGKFVEIVVDLPYANRRLNTSVKKKWVLAHELGHAAGLQAHSGSKKNFMYKSIGSWKYGVTASQRRVMRGR